MRIKKKNKNEYLLTEGDVWVRNFCNSGPFVDINNLSSPSDYRLYLNNELDNYKAKFGIIEGNTIHYPNVVIVSDGFCFEQKQELLNQLPKGVIIFGVNRSLIKWTLKTPMSHYVVNNPYSECLKYLPSKRFPSCAASTRTNSEFIKRYKGEKFFFLPTPNNNYSSPMSDERLLVVDDYRNPICAAIGLAHHFNVEKILLFCCDDSFDQERPGAVRLENNLWTYPQQLLSQHIIDSNLYWLKKQEIRIGNYSSGIKYVNAEYIEGNKIADFFGSQNG
jgi:hypothetical protein